MTIYNYTAVKNGKEIVKGKIDASDERDARTKVRALGFLPTKIEQDISSTNNTEKAKDVNPKEEKKKIPSLGLQDKIDFTSTMQILAKAPTSQKECHDP